MEPGVEPLYPGGTMNNNGETLRHDVEPFGGSQARFRGRFPGAVPGIPGRGRAGGGSLMVYSLDGVVAGLKASRDDDDNDGTAEAADRGTANRPPAIPALKASRDNEGGLDGHNNDDDMAEGAPAGKTATAPVPGARSWGRNKWRGRGGISGHRSGQPQQQQQQQQPQGRGQGGQNPRFAMTRDILRYVEAADRGTADRGTAGRPPAITALKASRDNEGGLDGHNNDDDMAEGAPAGKTTAPPPPPGAGARSWGRNKWRGRGGISGHRSGQPQQPHGRGQGGQNPRFAMTQDIHRYAEVVERCYRRFGTDPGAFDGQTITGFMDMMKVKGLSAGRRAFYATRFVGLLDVIPRTGVSRISELDTEQCKKVLAEFVSDESGYAGETKVAYAMCFKKLVQYSKTRNWGDRRALQGDPEAYVPEIAWITPARYRPKSGGVQRKDLLTSEEFSRMVRAAGNVRDRALLWTMMEGAFRPGEILNMRVGGVEFADRYMMVSTSGKTGQKNLALVLSLQPMAEWFRLHPHADDPEAPLWFSPMARNNGMALTYAGLAKMVRKTALKAGLKKPVWNYLLRHTQLTNMSTKLSDHLLRVYGNWKPGSKMSARYTHLSALDAKDAILAMHGIGEGGRAPQRPQQQQQGEGGGDARRSPGGGGGAPSPPAPEQTVGSTLRLRECPRCRAGNTPDTSLCHSCGLLLDETELAQVQVTDLVRSRLNDRVLRAKAVEEELDSLLDRNYDFSGM